MSKSGKLEDEAKLLLLRKANPGREWKSLEETVRCVLCEKTFRGRDLRITWDSRGKPRLSCPTPGCLSAPNAWVHPGDPLTCEKAWRDWERLLGAV